MNGGGEGRRSGVSLRKISPFINAVPSSALLTDALSTMFHLRPSLLPSSSFQLRAHVSFDFALNDNSLLKPVPVFGIILEVSCFEG